MINKRPIAVLISDIHYSLQTLEVADKAMNMAVDKANELGVRLIVCGDLHDTKANLRGECVNVMINTFRRAKSVLKLRPIVLVGNHDRINEKSTEHSLSFLNDLALVYNIMAYEFGCIVPYQHDPAQFKTLIDCVSKHSTVIMHQGVQTSNSGHYIHDKSAVPKEWLSGHRVISGHYHTRQTIELPEGGTLDYVGNPYTLTFNEAKDPEKGFQILYDDGNLEFVPTNLRRHKIIEINASSPIEPHDIKSDDILWVKIKGTKQELSQFSKEKAAKMLNISQSFKYDSISIDNVPEIQAVDHNQTQAELFDSLISRQIQDRDDIVRLQAYWKQFINKGGQ